MFQETISFYYGRNYNTVPGKSLTSLIDLKNHYAELPQRTKTTINGKIKRDIFLKLWKLRESDGQVISSFIHIFLISIKILHAAEEEHVLVRDDNLIETALPLTEDQEEAELEYENNSTIPTQSQTVEVKLNDTFLRRVVDNTSLFPQEGPKAKSHATNTNKAESKFIFLYLAEIINIECHNEIKCAKYKIGYIIRDEFNSAHKSRITHLTPYANFHWYTYYL